MAEGVLLPGLRGSLSILHGRLSKRSKPRGGHTPESSTRVIVANRWASGDVASQRLCANSQGIVVTLTLVQGADLHSVDALRSLGESLGVVNALLSRVADDLIGTGLHTKESFGQNIHDSLRV